MSFSIIVKKKRRTKSRRSSLLPRLAIYLDFGGKEIVIKYTSLIEAILNAKKKGPLSFKSVMASSLDQLQDIPLGRLSKKELTKLQKLIKGKPKR